MGLIFKELAPQGRTVEHAVTPNTLALSPDVLERGLEQTIFHTGDSKHGTM
jgi:hypothetical protein